jgi:hypothetical protein
MDMGPVKEHRIGAWPWVGIGLADRGGKMNGKDAGAGGGCDGDGGCGYGGASGGERSGRSGYGAGTVNASTRMAMATIGVEVMALLAIAARVMDELQPAGLHYNALSGRYQSF